MKTIIEMAEEYVSKNGGDKESYIWGAYEMMEEVERIIYKKGRSNYRKIDDIIIMAGDKVKGM